MIKTPSTRATGAPAPMAALGLGGERQSEAREPMLDAERLDVYRVALEFQSVACVMATRADAVVRDQLRRASLSVVLNIAEGAGLRSRAQKRSLYGIARGSAMECAAIVDVLRMRGVVSAREAREARGYLVRLVQMLTKLDRSLG